MKKTVLLLLLALAFFTLKAQDLPPKKELKLSDKELGLQYLKKSRSFKIAGWSLLAGGILITAIGTSQASQDIFNPDTGRETLALVGSIMVFGSFPCFIAGAKNKGRAEMLLRNENIMLSNRSKRSFSFPSLSLAFKL